MDRACYLCYTDCPRRIEEVTLTQKGGGGRREQYVRLDGNIAIYERCFGTWKYQAHCFNAILPSPLTQLQ